MRRRRLLWQIYPYFIFLMLMALGAVAWYATVSVAHFYDDQMRNTLATRARLVAREILPCIRSRDSESVDRAAKMLGVVAETRVTVVDAAGTVLGDSETDPGGMENHSDRPEIAAAIEGRAGSSIRVSPTLGIRMMYVAVPLQDGLSQTYAVRVALPMGQLDRTIGDLQNNILLVAAVTAVLGALIAFVISRGIARPLQEMRVGIERLASGDLSHRLRIPRSFEIGTLADGINRMAAQLEDRIQVVVEQRNEQDAVFGSMTEGVFAVDVDERIMRMNDAAGGILNVRPGEAIGKTIQEAVRHPELQDLISQSLESDSPVEGEISVSGGAEALVLQVHGAALRDARSARLGAVLVMNDVTRIRRLERFRKDFVANVSHELRTPITSIKGFVETLQDGALNDAIEARNFLDIIARQADRLDAIINDLLLLSSLEQQTGMSGVSFQTASLTEMLNEAVELCGYKAGRKNVRILLTVPAGLRGNVNVNLLEQAVVNLLDNAVKYSPGGSTIEVEASASPEEILISVRDHGCGIPAEHLPRIFERFYVVDKARSRDMGGTGLGLAIVKHIAQAHLGTVTVESVVGEGSTFALHLPRA